MRDLKGRNALVTGASSGIGPYIARSLAREGINVVLAARSADRLARLAGELTDMGIRAVAVPTDLTDADERESLLSRARSALGPIDILVNGAGALNAGRLHTLTAAEVEAVIETNLAAPLLLTRALLDDMRERRTGHIVQIASLAGKVALPYASVYAASKHGLVGFTHSLQAELAGTGVHASVVCPGFIAGEGMWARMKRRVHPAFGLSTPERVARAVVRVIRHPRVEVLVNPLPVRPAIASWALMPGVAAGLFRAIGVNAFLRGVADQAEHDVVERGVMR